MMSGAKLKIFLIINGLDSGGAEKSTIKLCQSFLSDGHEVTLITISNKFDFYKLNESIRRINLDNPNKAKRKFPDGIGLNRPAHWADSFKKGVKLREILVQEKPDCVISMSAKVAVFTFLSTRFLSFPQIGSERIHPNPKVFSHGRMTDKLRPFIYKSGVVLSVQTAGVAKWCKENWKMGSFLTPNHLTNFPTDEELANSVPISMRQDEVLAISRDHPQKNLEFLLQSWVFVEKSNPNAHLSLVGLENSLRIESIGKKLGLLNFSCHLRTEQLTDFFGKAKLFISTSRFEGFPNVILEAISFGIPVISTPSCDLVEDFAKKEAVIVDYSENPEEFALTIIKAIKNNEQLALMSQNAINVSRIYSWDQVGKSWYAAIESAKTSSKLRRR
jgi:glycosyltransferase involved in cell wall biosynthesis